jgi:predicted metal-dependent enzyme (double-stranded beta helix superfamily)
MEPLAPSRLVHFIATLDGILADYGPLDSAAPPAAFLERAAAALARLVAEGDWLPAPYRQPDPAFYQQYLLYLDPKERFSVVSFVWGPGQRTPIHDHQVWGMVGVLQGAELCQNYAVQARGVAARGPARRLEKGDVEILSPVAGDIHRVENAFHDRVSISIHVYGADIGRVRRWVYPIDAPRKPFVSGYGNKADNPPFALIAA